MDKLKLDKNIKNIFLLFIFICFVVIFFITIRKYILFNKLKSEFNRKTIILEKKICNHKNYTKNINDILKYNNNNNLNLIEFKDLYSLILDFNNNLNKNNIKKDRIDIGYKEFIEKYEGKDIIKIPIKIKCYNKYKNLTKYIEYLESVNKFVIIDDIILNLKEEKEKFEEGFEEEFNIEIYLYVLVLYDNND